MPSENLIPTKPYLSNYEPGCLSTLCAMQAAYYAREWNLDHQYESVVAQGVSEFLQRLKQKQHFIRLVKVGDEICGGIAIDNKDDSLGQLRWFIVNDKVRGFGMGKALIESAMDFVRASSLQKVFLTTFDGLNSARKLYDQAGFIVAEEKLATTWGRELKEQRLEWAR